MTINSRFMQAQADILSKTITNRERDTCWGVAKGVLTSLAEPLESFIDQKVTVYSPDEQQREKLCGKYSRWVGERQKFYDWK
jgi:hypothetical protein